MRSITESDGVHGEFKGCEKDMSLFRFVNMCVTLL